MITRRNLVNRSLFWACAACCSTHAQDVFDPPAIATPSDIPTASPSTYGASADFETEGTVAPWYEALTGPVQQILEEPLKWGPFRLRPHVRYGFTYATKVNQQPGQPTDTAKHDIAPGMAFVGERWLIDYTPTLTYYTKGDFDDRLNHRVSATGGFVLGAWSFALTQGYNNSASPSIETGEDLQREIFSTSISATRPITDRTSFSSSLSQSLRFSEEGNDSKQWSVMNWVDHAYTDTTRIGVGFGGGYVDVEEGSDMSYEQLQGRISWSPGSKFYLSANGGVEIRQFLDIPEADDTVNPIMGFTARYNIREGTSVNASANRAMRTSFIANNVSESTVFRLGLNQHIVARVNLTVTGSYSYSDYLSSDTQVETTRTDKTMKIRTALGTPFLERGNISVFYQYVRNNTDAEGFDVSSHQYGASISYSF